MSKPTWIIFEGIDGSGKTTQAKLLNEYLNKNGVKCLYRHVFDSKAGQLLREIFINNSFSNTVEILILCATRKAYLDELIAEEANYKVVIIDRFFQSILAMQGNTDNDIELINYLQKNILDKRDFSHIYHMSTLPEECKRRLRNKGSNDRIEEKSIEFHRVVFERYLLLLANQDNVHHFDGYGEIETIHRTIVDKTMHLLGASS